MNFEKEQDKENLTITPEKELEYAMEGVNEENWGDVVECLTQFTTKVSEAGLSAEDRGKLQPKLEEIKNALTEKDVPESHKSQIETKLQQAKEKL